VHSCKLELPIRMFSLLARGSVNVQQGFTVGLPRGDVVVTARDVTLP
jgi:hypothetical protein